MRGDAVSEPWELAISNSLATATNKLSDNPNSVNPFGPVNRESPRDSAILAGVGIRKRAILDVDLAGRDEQLGAAVNKKARKTRDLNEKSRDSRLGFLCLPDWLSFEPILKGSSGRTRTCDPAINSRLLYQLSYRGSKKSGTGQNDWRKPE